jgi:hypothetical protein
MTLPASGFGLPISGRVTATGELAQTEIVMIDAVTGFFWRATVSGSPSVWVFTAVPDVADIEAGFATVLQLETAVGTCAQLKTWGYA